MLGVRPYLYSSAGRLDQGSPVGMVANGTQWLIGKVVAVDEAVVPIDWMHDKVVEFVKVSKIRGSVTPHKETFSVEGENWAMSVIHDGFVDGYECEQIRLKVLHAPEFGIQCNTHLNVNTPVQVKQEAPVQEHENVVPDPKPVQMQTAPVSQPKIMAANDRGAQEINILDPENEMDRAILEKLQKKKEESERAQQPEAPKPVEPMEPWQGRQRNNDVGALRELANRGRHDNQQKPDGGSVSNKVSGLFSKKHA